jgi:hypothetical protein
MGRPGKKEKVEIPDAEENWKSKDPKMLAYEIATFMGGEWPTRPVRKVQISLDGAPADDEELFEITQLNPTLLSEMTIKTRFLFLEVYFDDIQDVYSQVMETLVRENGVDLCAARPPSPGALGGCVVHRSRSRAPPRRVTYDSLRKFKHLTISLAFNAVSDVCQRAFDKTDFDEFPEARAPPRATAQRRPTRARALSALTRRMRARRWRPTSDPGACARST